MREDTSRPPMQLMSGLKIDLGDGLIAHLDAGRHLTERYFDIVDDVFCRINGWSIGPVDRTHFYGTSRVVVFVKDGTVLGGFTSDRTGQPETRIHDRFRGQKGVPPLELISSHGNISYNANLVLTGDARKMGFKAAIRDLTIAIPRLEARDFVIVSPAFKPHRLDLFYEMYGFSRISAPVFNGMYALSDDDVEPNCVMMMRSISPHCRLDTRLLAYGNPF